MKNKSLVLSMMRTLVISLVVVIPLQKDSFQPQLLLMHSCMLSTFRVTGNGVISSTIQVSRSIISLAVKWIAMEFSWLLV